MVFQLSKTKLFSGTTENEAQTMLNCLSSNTKNYVKGATIYHAGENISNIGMVLKGSANIENNDVFGNKSILSHIEPGEIFGETYACLPSHPLLVSVVASEDCSILFMNVSKVLTTCSHSCSHHNILIKKIS